MEVRRFKAGWDYEKWIENLAFSIDIISIVVFNHELVVTFKRK
jgi:hypothetical protein